MHEVPELFKGLGVLRGNNTQQGRSRAYGHYEQRIDAQVT